MMRGRPAIRLTREHSEALRLAARLQVCDAASAAEDRRELLRYWYGSGATHLGGEEELLVGAWARHGGDDQPLPAAIRAERERLSEAIGAVAMSPRALPETLRMIGRDLSGHVHRHEGELYGAVERVLPPNELEDVERDLEQFRRGAHA
jgi:hypothetical protein